MPARPPNVVYIHTHDTGRYIAPYGHAVSTPGLQGLAERGVLFRRAFSAAPTCSPSRAALLTGQCPHSAGMPGLAHLGFALHDYSQHIVHTLRGAGYRSAMVGVQHVASGPDEAAIIGYDERLDASDRMAPATARAAVEFLRRDHDRPFFLSVGLTETHTMPGGGGTFGYPAVDERYVAAPPTLPDTARTRADMASFATAVRAADDAVGRVLAALDETGLAADTLVIATTDHGLPLPDMKCTLTDHGIGVLLIIAGPDPFSGGRVIDVPVSQLDLFPTICDLAGIAHPPWLQGQSLVPLPDGSVERDIFAEINYHVSYEPTRAVRTSRWCYVRSYGDYGRKPLANVDTSPSKDVWVEAGWADRPVAGEQVYDLTFDPQERCNLAGRLEVAAVTADLAGRLDAWMRRTDDPLLHGAVPAPAGAPVLPPQASSPDRSSPA